MADKFKIGDIVRRMGNGWTLTGSRACRIVDRYTNEHDEIMIRVELVEPDDEGIAKILANDCWFKAKYWEYA